MVAVFTSVGTLQPVPLEIVLVTVYVPIVLAAKFTAPVNELIEIPKTINEWEKKIGIILILKMSIIIMLIILKKKKKIVRRNTGWLTAEWCSEKEKKFFFEKKNFLCK